MGEVEDVKQKLIESQNKVAELTSNIETIKDKSTVSHEVKTITQEEIDALVDEIEYCIAQLKQ